MSDSNAERAPAVQQSPKGMRGIPIAERPRERFRQRGAAALSAAELLAILLGSGTGGRPALVVAHEVLSGAGGSLRRLATTPLSVLTDITGVGTARAVTIHAAIELGRRMAAEAHIEGASIRNPRDIYNMFAPRLEDLPVEEFHVATLDTQHRFERDILVTRGLLDTAIVHPREVYREAIAERAAAIILVHNHPSGDPTPSPEDRAVTEQLVLAGRLLGIPVFDHVVIGRGRFISFAEAGLL
jgi:DNA repair protein RadC